jgi:hypothetical protein
MSNAQLVVDALYQTNEALHQAIDGGGSWLASLTKRGARVALYRKYERGESRSSMTEQMRKMLRLVEDESGIEDLADSYIGIVISKFAGRVAVSEISTGDNSADKTWLEPMLARQDFQAAEGMWWRGAIRDGDAFVMIDPVTMLWSSEPAFDGWSGMVAIYNQMTRKPVWACKVWSESDTLDQTNDEGEILGTVKVMRLIVYQPDKISYWQGQDGGAEVEPMPQDDGETEQVWPPELAGALPFVSFANQRDNYTRYGDSEIRPAIPLQDVLNRTMYSMVMASEFAAFPVNWSKGMAINPGGIVPGGIINLTLNNAQGQPITEFTAEQIQFISASSVGQFGAADISQYTNQIQTVVKEISQATQTPIYGITAGGAVSGDALKQLEIGLIGKVVRFQRQNTDALKELIMLTAKIERVYQPALGTPEVTNVAITWKSPELLDANVAITALVAMRSSAPGLWADKFYQQKIGQLLGMSKDDIAEEIDALAKEKAAAKPVPPPATDNTQVGATDTAMAGDTMASMESSPAGNMPKSQNAIPMMGGNGSGTRANNA